MSNPHCSPSLDAHPTAFDVRQAGVNQPTNQPHHSRLHQMPPPSKCISFNGMTRLRQMYYSKVSDTSSVLLGPNEYVSCDRSLPTKPGGTGKQLKYAWERTFPVRFLVGLTTWKSTESLPLKTPEGR